ncbi:hypothetical protein BGZ51_004731 [Haplosporangium sp. Z 767]|nr:hypothetical protein BGZ51_004731 [Haplosporangium sp. Z 767]
MLARTGLKYPSKLHCEKVASFLSENARHEAIILTKGTEAQNRDNTDTELDFRQESNFFYLTGVQEADFYFIYDLSRCRSYLIAPDLDPVKAIWKGPSPSDNELLKKYDVDRVVRYSELLNLLKLELCPKQIHGWGRPEKGHPLSDKALEHELEHYISHRLVRPKEHSPSHLPNHPHHHGPYGDHHGHRCGHHKHMRDKNREDSAEPEEITLLEALILARINKTPIEIALSRESTRISSDAHRLILKSARPGMFEYQLEALFRYECARQGAKAQAYLPIVGAGVNGAYLHYTRNDTQIKDGDLVLIDAACEADCYGSDITRTFPVNGRFSPEQADIYNLVLEMQNSVIQSMAEGVDWRDMNVLAQKVGIRGLKRLGILKGDDNDLFENNVIKVFFPHGLGHLLGLNVHDDGLGLSIQVPPKNFVQGLKKRSNLPVEFHSMTIDDSKYKPCNDCENGEKVIDFVNYPPPSSRRNRAMGSSFYAAPSTQLKAGMLLTVEPGIYFNPAQIEMALETSYIAKFLNESTLRQYMSVGGVRIEDVVLILPNGTVENITTAPKDLKEIERIVQEGQRQRQLSQHLDCEPDDLRKCSKVQETNAESPSPMPRGVKKRVGIFKKLMRAIRSMF